MALLRHGKTDGNLRGAYIGRTDLPLCELGVKELRELRVPGAEIVICSPLRRCVQTAEIFYRGIKRIEVPELRERDFGEFEGLTHGEIITRRGYEGWGMDEDSMVFPGGEEREAFFSRSRAGFSRAMRIIAQSGEKSAAIVTHGGVIMAALSMLEPGGSVYRFQAGCGRGWVLELDSESGGLTVVSETSKMIGSDDE